MSKYEWIEKKKKFLDEKVLNESESESEESPEPSDDSFIDDESDEETTPNRVNKLLYIFLITIHIFNDCTFSFIFRKPKVKKQIWLKPMEKLKLLSSINLLLLLLKNLLRK